MVCQHARICAVFSSDVAIASGTGSTSAADCARPFGSSCSVPYPTDMVPRLPGLRHDGHGALQRPPQDDDRLAEERRAAQGGHLANGNWSRSADFTISQSTSGDMPRCCAAWRCGCTSL